LLGAQELAKRHGIGGFGKQETEALLVGLKRGLGFGKRLEVRNLETAGLLRRLEEDFLPAFGALRSGREKGFFAARSGERDDAADAELGGFFEGPFEDVEFHDSEQKCGFERGCLAGQLFDQSELDAIARNGFNASEPGIRAVAQFVELARLGTKDAA